jgi:hypothetical protein
LAHAKEKGKQVACFSNMRQLALAARFYMDDHDGGLFHHHEGWVLDDGSQVDTLPADLGGVGGGGMGNSQAEKPWIIFFQPYLNNRRVGFCPSDRTKRSQFLATELNSYNGNFTSTDQSPPSTSVLAVVLRERLSVESYHGGPLELVPLTEDAPLREALYPYRDKAKGPEDWLYHYEKILVEKQGSLR